MSRPDPEYLVLAGSHGYGTNIESSDEDFRGFFLPSIRALLGFIGESESWVSAANVGVPTTPPVPDVALWEIRKFFKMCVQANPNVIETLFLPEKNILKASKMARSILAIRDKFLSKRLARTYIGYATGNWKRILVQTVDARLEKDTDGRPVYDVKDAMHLIRLCRTGSEVLRTGQLRVQRPEDRELFLSIRRGERPLGFIMDEFKLAQESWKTLEAESSLPDEPDEKFLNEFLVELMSSYVSKELVWDNLDPRD